MRRNASTERPSHKSSQKKLTRSTNPAFHAHFRTKTASYPHSLIAWKKLYYPYYSSSTKLACKNFPLFQKKKSQNAFFNLWLPQPDRFLSSIHENSLKKESLIKFRFHLSLLQKISIQSEFQPHYTYTLQCNIFEVITRNT